MSLESNPSFRGVQGFDGVRVIISRSRVSTHWIHQITIECWLKSSKTSQPGTPISYATPMAPTKRSARLALPKKRITECKACLAKKANYGVQGLPCQKNEFRSARLALPKKRISFRKACLAKKTNFVPQGSSCQKNKFRTARLLLPKQAQLLCDLSCVDK